MCSKFVVGFGRARQSAGFADDGGGDQCVAQVTPGTGLRRQANNYIQGEFNGARELSSRFPRFVYRERTTALGANAAIGPQLASCLRRRSGIPSRAQGEIEEDRQLRN